ncbi:MAG: acyl-CoA dehydrogenase family protein [Anaerolineae bacterium]|nr:acyl-CoA dehydrogenase family protein [Anaerolineae bacterium]MDW8172206.1 acyl-CoA dehydrogenase family protein [Anaerolineae bacterium]
MNAAVQGRQALLAWEAAKPRNFFSADSNLQAVLRRLLSPEDYEALLPRALALGEQAATIIDEACKQEDKIGNHPRLERWSALGERIEQIEFHPNHHAVGRLVWGSGIMAMQAQAGRTVQQMALYYLLGHNGEGGTMCALACTSGLIRALQRAADEATRARFLPPLLRTDYEQMEQGAQFLTEVQGGSDVGANAVQARLGEDGLWRVSGEKWFCSNVNAEQYLMTARATEADGTRGLGLFLVPRTLEDGTTNSFYIRRLKDKLGTRTLASAELDFRDAIAHPVGPIETGFKTVVELVLNTSRLMNAVACAGIMRRAYYEAAHYACHRVAFGQSIANYPLVQEAIADILSEASAATASSFYLAHLLDKAETGRASADELAIYRLLVNINKYVTSVRASEAVHRAIEVLGGNGAIESFSVLPRLYRDMVVLESWEGTHNVLALQVLRDIARYRLHEPFLARWQASLSATAHSALRPWADEALRAAERTQSMLARLLAHSHKRQDEAYAQAHARRLMDALAHLAQAALLLEEAEWELSNGPTSKPDVAAYFIQRRLLPNYDPLSDDEYLPRLQRLATTI